VEKTPGLKARTITVAQDGAAPLALKSLIIFERWYEG